jgi:hypothetical protein
MDQRDAEWPHGSSPRRIRLPTPPRATERRSSARERDLDTITPPSEAQRRHGSRLARRPMRAGTTYHRQGPAGHRCIATAGSTSSNELRFQGASGQFEFEPKR